ncbi:hypothetical protein TREMEDRAFT_28297 [Tremella mesenterica DSM 1558]|uniref:uncharacterized protein n=1 Tax=Tremella mesenterica (strain ATCC 24925 / CBS 8224 / DSM 1558 / NBRC 9311 / NRRL Y-6157 / RJB 2259-6 / UBC 559-6) TaxID=578456 RepID=UPI0003F49005|nr:uncharacterized protein TREMEDRAFT_28297 [Tremella mesenterica DSM 1558]EIW71492.1 hypothetical protein TREMEDRAFT_28297 [Tremella mesenterica DSM 1558]
MYSAALLFLLAPLAMAIQITSPATSDMWSSSSSSQTVVWQAVSTDPDSFEIQLVNQQGFLNNSPVTLVSNQATGSPNVQNSATITYPSGTWPSGRGFQINFVSTSSTTTTPAILAQSGQFNITDNGSASTSSTSSSSSSLTLPTTLSHSSTSTASATVTGSASGTSNGDASGGIPNSVSYLGFGEL